MLLVAAHRELEKLVLTKWQAFWKDQLSTFYGDRLHEGQYFDPALRDIEALLAHSQERVVGETRVRLAPGRFQVVGRAEPALDDGSARGDATARRTCSGPATRRAPSRAWPPFRPCSPPAPPGSG